LGESDTTINTVDADGVNLLAVQALERRTAELKSENQELRAAVARVEATVQRIVELADSRVAEGLGGLLEWRY